MRFCIRLCFMSICGKFLIPYIQILKSNGEMKVMRINLP